MFFVLLGLDILIKDLILDWLSLGQSFPLISNILHVTLVKNTGVAFGLFAGQGKWATMVPLGIIVAMMVFHKTLHEGQRLRKVLFVMILAGACGNVWDRFRYGAVIDYIDIRVWPVFNLADSLICIGFGGLVICTLFCSK